MTSVLSSVDPNFEWTYLDPSEADPPLRVCHGREQLGRWGRPGGPGMTLEELVSYGDRVLVVTRVPGLDDRRARKTGDRNFHVVTLRDGRMVALRACRSREEAEELATGSEQSG